ncbi:Golgi integral membrane protein 4-like [Scleropages formosus]|uniref:Golgi integral membrane protein 4-like n=1 Tax=Scleropages formosus TaxID=113540 RepID=UPI000878F914|nr:Golgi integral membrane protein 4-like [Scleropages formosus]XP_029104863.1 Golgi integral membrane protein 4-like isoform X2 [Scleropages formosus]XP_029105290.1 Golgi integral membrane protein 4-like [Scleropages formosus]XP_029105292.1 Golgi integral membrane protein 4-like [Scleropages formosus]
MLLGLCWRRHKCSGVSALIVLSVCTACAGLLLLLSRLREGTEELLRHKQHCRQQEEALSVQLQVVYEHRSRLERSLQKERAEHKKTKEDFLQYKLEIQEALNKEKNQLVDLHSQLQLQQKEHGQQHLAQLKSLEDCQQRAALLRTESQGQISSLQDLVVKLQEESKLLRHSHQDMHHRLLNAQARVEELQRVRKTFPKKPGQPATWREQEFITGFLQLDHKTTTVHHPEEKSLRTVTEAPGKIHPISQRGLSVRDVEKRGTAGTNELEGARAEIPDDERDFGGRRGDEGLEIAIHQLVDGVCEVSSR